MHQFTKNNKQKLKYEMQTNKAENEIIMYREDLFTNILIVVWITNLLIKYDCCVTDIISVLLVFTIYSIYIVFFTYTECPPPIQTQQLKNYFCIE